MGPRVNGSRVAVRAAATPWWSVPGATCIAAYQPKGAADLAASYVNLANPGTYNAAPGVAPTIGVDGWIFDGTTQYLTTGVVFGATWTVTVRFSGVASSLRYAIGALSTDIARNVGIVPVNGASHRYVHGTVLELAGAQTGDAVMTVAGTLGYLNGTADAGTMTPGVGVDRALFIGARNLGSAGQFHNGKIAAIAIHSSTLDATAVAALTTRMQAL